MKSRCQVAQAELAVGNHMVPGGLLLFHQTADGPILRDLQLIGPDLSILKIGPGLLQLPGERGSCPTKS